MRTASLGGRSPPFRNRRTIAYDEVSTSTENVERGSWATRTNGLADMWSWAERRRRRRGPRGGGPRRACGAGGLAGCLWGHDLDQAAADGGDARYRLPRRALRPRAGGPSVADPALDADPGR